MKIVVAEPIAVKLNKLIESHAKDWAVYTDTPQSSEELVERIKDAEAATAYSVKFTEEVLAQSPRLKYLAIPAVGAGFFVDMEAAKRRGIVVMNCPGYNSTAVAELAIVLALSVLRRVTREHNKIESGKWSHIPVAGSLIRGKRVGLIGHGNIGRNLEAILQGWAKEVVCIDSKSSLGELDNLISLSDIIFVCCPLTPQTKGLLNADRLDKMKKSAILINVSRAQVIDEDALYNKLVAQEIAGAGLDVFAGEPDYGDKAPSSIVRFAVLDNVVCTPHVAGTSLETQDILGRMIFDNLEGAEKNEPVNIYNE